MVKRGIKITNATVVGDDGTFMRLETGSDTDYPIEIDGLNIHGNRMTTFDIKTFPSLIKQLGLPKHTNPKELYDLLLILEKRNPEERPQIIKESKFFRTLSIAADATAIIPVIAGIVMRPEFEQIMRSLHQILLGNG